MATEELPRCPWGTGDPLYTAYHDREWGVPAHDDRVLFEMLCLEGAQAGLSWITILRRREGYRAAFDNFDAERIAAYDEEKIAALMDDARIVRNRAKIRSVVDNAGAFSRVREELGSFDAYIWQFVGGEPRVNCPATMADLPAETAESRAMSKDLKKRGFSFVGPTICYAFMQACGMVDDHIADCFRARCGGRAASYELRAVSYELRAVSEERQAASDQRRGTSIQHLADNYACFL